MSFPDHHPESPAGPRVRSVRVRVRERAPTFGTNSRFQVELRRRVDAYFDRSGRRQRDCWRVYLKTAILVACYVVS